MLNVGGVISTVQVTVLEALAILPHASLAVKVLVCERSQPLTTTAPSTVVNVGEPQASEAVATPRPDIMSEGSGLQPRSVGPPVIVTNGGVTSTIQLAVLVTTELLPHPSAAINVLVCERLQPFTVTALVDTRNVGGLHASVTVAVPSTDSIPLMVGLQPR